MLDLHHSGCISVGAIIHNPPMFLCCCYTPESGIQFPPFVYKSGIVLLGVVGIMPHVVAVVDTRSVSQNVESIYPFSEKFVHLVPS